MSLWITAPQVRRVTVSIHEQGYAVCRGCAKLYTDIAAKNRHALQCCRQRKESTHEEHKVCAK
jgi:hypothetical protein